MPLNSGSTQISRLQTDLGCELIPTVKARKAIVTASQALQSNQQKQLADYLTHSAEVAKSKYREINKSVTVEVAKMIQILTEKDIATDDSPIEDLQPEIEPETQETSSDISEPSSERNFAVLREAHPISTSAEGCPKRQEVISLQKLNPLDPDTTKTADKQLSKWRYEQQQLRKQHLVEQCQIRGLTLKELKNEELVKSWKLKEKTLKNIISLSDKSCPAPPSGSDLS